MLKYRIIFVFLFPWLAVATPPKVPSHMEFAGIKLNIHESARREIQKDVDALHRNQNYLRKKIEKIDLYFPIIERVLREENVPEDFKYLVIQESALIADAVSTSNAVGFWQFKAETAREMGLRVDRYIDERMNIVASTRAAAGYLKKNNFYFDNWVYALLAYNTGRGGAERYVQRKYLGAKKMDISRHTHWYVKKFLAHKVAFENEINKNSKPHLHLFEYDKINNKSLKDLADYFEVDYNRLREYNKWLRKDRKIPADKTYVAIIPVLPDDLVAQNLLSPRKTFNPTVTSKTSHPKSKLTFHSIYKPISEFNFEKNLEYPKIKKSPGSRLVTINGIKGFIAYTSDDFNSISRDFNISLSKFLKYNDLTISDKIIPDQFYYLKPKRLKARIHYHVVLPGENAWYISQKYGLKLKKLLAKNRMREEKDLNAGMVLWLRFIRPADVPVEYKEPTANHVIVKSTSNNIDYPLTQAPDPLPEIESSPNSGHGESVNNNATEDSEYFFEEVNENTDYIDDNSFINLEETTEIKSEETTNTRLHENQGYKIKNVKNETIYHIVKSGETLFSISREYGITIGQIRQWNDIGDLDVLNVGQKIIILKPTVAVSKNSIADYKTYTVKKDDTLYSIARMHNVSIKELMEWNDKIDFMIREGEVLKIKVSR